MCWGMSGATPRHPGGIYNDTLLLHDSRSGVSAAPTSWLSPLASCAPSVPKAAQSMGTELSPRSTSKCAHPAVFILTSCCLWRCLWPRGLCCLSPRQSPSAGWRSLRGCVCSSSQWAAWVSQRTCPRGLASHDAACVASAVRTTGCLPSVEATAAGEGRSGEPSSAGLGLGLL